MKDAHAKETNRLSPAGYQGSTSLVTDPSMCDVWAAADISDSGFSGFLYAAVAGWT